MVVEQAIDFTAGAVYGATTVVVGQPLDTIKTRMQALSGRPSATGVAKELWRKEGVRGLYRGSLPPLIFGSFFRSFQFGFYASALPVIRRNLPEKKIGFFDYQVLLAGMFGGVGRGLVEGPADYIKVRQQVGEAWTLREMFTDRGTAMCMFRNIWLMGAFAFFVDLSKYCNGGEPVSPFLTGALCSCPAWLMVWPLDVVKSQAQSGLYKSSFVDLLGAAYRSGALFRGLAPGLTRSFVANGTSFVMLKHTQKILRERFTDDSARDKSAM
eukprot:Hpha_TRINITY_DN15899_c1_g12::TRINITY_DN15899_c1_g12_i1::g.190881::m.190881/K15109/SLC25A20_29, CACT, CACL, CRC1; solute carrier family 25 (mitochondrial carnitine/acylcarnitine transporter), member 20/29